MRICLYGGTFDPPHKGHLAIAKQCLQEFKIDRVLFIPAFLAPHKTHLSTSAAFHRLNMLKLALEPHPGISISEFELNREGVSFSINTILAMKQEYQLDRDRIFFLIGADSLTEFSTWREPDRILAECQVIVAGRPGYSLDNVPLKYRNKVRVLSNPLMDISSSDIRHKIRMNDAVDDLLPENVRDYIVRHRLYQD